MTRIAHISPLVMAAMMTGALMGCEVQDKGDVTRLDADSPASDFEYLGIETRLLEGDLVQFVVRMGGTPDNDHVAAYSECAAAQYALIRGYGFARHVRTTITNENEARRGDAVYTISAALPRGLKTIDAEIVAQNCAQNAIPMV